MPEELYENEILKSSALITVQVTAPNAEAARSISKQLVREKLVACVNIVPGLLSIYEWEGELEESQEVLMIIKVWTYHYFSTKNNLS